MTMIKKLIYLGAITVCFSACQAVFLPEPSSAIQEIETKVPQTPPAPTNTVTNGPEPTAQVMTPTGSQTFSPDLADNLKSGCTKKDPKTSSPKEGELAVEFSLRDVNGVEYTLSEMLSEKPVYMIFGSFT
ncbi:MAG: hypothetical protein ACC633_02285 [Anaerolineales bacterium]